MRAIPLRPEGELIGALVLVRDVTDLRRRDRELVTKDATIREIHHRVKNNLQTVAALLRLQARRMDSTDAKAALEEAVRRVGSIAIVHETLSQALEENVAFDDVADRLGGMVADVGSLGGGPRVRREGSFGVLPSETATTVAMVLTELLQNAVEHGYPAAEGDSEGQIVVSAGRAGDRLQFTRRRRRARAATGIRRGRLEHPGAVDRRDPGGVRAGWPADHRAGARRGAAPAPRSTYRLLT